MIKIARKKANINTILQKQPPEIEKTLGMYAEDNNAAIEKFIVFHLKADSKAILIEPRNKIKKKKRNK